jgi:hypothetical protein
MGPSSVSGIGLLDCVGWWFSAGLDPAFPMGESYSPYNRKNFTNQVKRI